MVRRAKLPRDSSNRVMSFGLSHRELSGWPDGISYSPRKRKKRKKYKTKEKEPETVDIESLPVFIPEALDIGETL